MSNYKRYRALIAQLGMTQLGAARFLDIGSRTSRRWANDEIDVPLAVIMLLELMVKHGFDPYELRKLAGRSDKHATYTDRRLVEGGSEPLEE
jgi:hypothetical protein